MDLLSASRLGTLCLFLGFLQFGTSAHAQASWVSPEDEYKNRVHVSDNVAPLGNTPFGENLSLVDGQLSFSQTDIASSGLGPGISVIRSFSTPNDNTGYAFHAFHSNAFVDWDLVVPHIETLSAPTKVVGAGGVVTYQWYLVDDFYGTQRCSGLGVAPAMVVSQGATTGTYSAEEWSHGYQLVTASGSQQLLVRSSGNSQFPQMTDASNNPLAFPLVTKEHWAIACLASTANGVAGQGYLAVAPDGTKYYLDWVVARSADAVLGEPGVALKRKKLSFMVSKAMDRFGNTVNYSYDANGNLTDISSPDGRHVKIEYEMWLAPTADPGPGVPATTYTSYRITKITQQPESATPRVWTYSYDTANTLLPRLKQITLPDTSQWSFDLGGIPATNPAALLEYSGVQGTCFYISHPEGAATGSGTIIHPSGLVGTFSVKTMVHGRSHVPVACSNPHVVGILPKVYATTSITSKTFSGPGVATNQTWSYTYSGTNDSWDENCTAGCLDRVYTDVQDPAGNVTRYTFSNHFDATEGQQTQIDQYQGIASSNILLSSEVTSYASPTGNAWPALLGATEDLTANDAQLAELTPVTSRVIHENGDTFSWTASAFDVFANPTQTVRSSSANSLVLSETISYLNEPHNWVIGLEQERDNAANGDVISKTVWDATHVTATSRWTFGRQTESYTHDSQGQITSATDGDTNQTQFSLFQRGIPLNILAADGTVSKRTLDDFGDVSSVTDESNRVTTYRRDSLGRISNVQYPTDSSGNHVWADKASSMVPVSTAERGISAGHWRRTITQGDKQQVIYFDAFLRPILTDVSRISDGGLHITSRLDYDWRSNTSKMYYPKDGSLSVADFTAGTTTFYDALGRVSQLIQDSEQGALTTTVSYIGNASKKTVDPRGKVTVTKYQQFDSPDFTNAVSITLPMNVVQTMARDAYGNVYSVMRGDGIRSVTKTFGYDAAYRLCRTTGVESGSQVMSYDGASNLVWSAQGIPYYPPATVENEHDCGPVVADAAKTYRSYYASNLVKDVTYPAGTPDSHFTYTSTHKISTSSLGGVQWTYVYNSLDKISGETLAVDGYNWAFGFGYDQNGASSTILYPDNKLVYLQPDALGRPTALYTLGANAATYASGGLYFPTGELKQAALGNGGAYSASLNSRMLVSGFSWGTADAPVLDENLGYDAAANLVNIADNTPTASRAKSLFYDDLSRLYKLIPAAGMAEQDVTYDGLGNITSLTTAGQNATYTYDTSNHLTQISDASGAVTTAYQYDVRGNVAAKNQVPVIFDEANRLATIQGNDSFVYDAAGRRVKKISGGAVTYFAYSDSGQLLWTYDPTTTKGSDELYLGSKFIATTVNVTSAVTGNINSVSAGSNSVATGYACSTGLVGSITVTAYIGGPPGTGTALPSVTANQASDTAAQAACHTTATTYGFSIPIPEATRIASSNAPIYVLGLSPVGNANALLNGSGSFTVPPSVSAPAAVSVLNATAAGDLSSISLAWSSVSNATTYDVEEQVNGGAWTELVTQAGTSYLVSAPADGSYVFRIEACNTYGCSAWISSGGVSIAHLPTTPAAISVPGTSNGPLAIGWSGSSYAAYYSVEQNPGSGWTVLYNGGGNSYAQTLTASGTYSYRVRACNANGCSAYGPVGTSVVTVPPIQAPNISVPATNTNGCYTVNWGGFSGMTSYVMQEQINGGAFSTIANNGSGTLAICGKGNGSYGYRVQGCNVGGCGPFSATVTVTVALIPPVPTGLTLTTTGPASNKTVHLAWNAAAGAISYTIKQTLQPGGSSDVYTGSATTFLSHILYSGPVSYDVRACNASGCSAESAQVNTFLLNAN